MEAFWSARIGSYAWRALAPGCLALALVLSGCGAAEAGGGESLPFGVFEPTAEGSGALLRGKLTLEGGCLVVKPETGTTYAVWWPSTASWDKSAQALTVNGTTYRMGDKVEVGGGEIEGAPPSGGPDACKSYRVFMATSP